MPINKNNKRVYITIPKESLELADLICKEMEISKSDLLLGLFNRFIKGLNTQIEKEEKEKHGC